MDHKLTDMNLLYDAFRSSMKGSSWKTEPQKFEQNFLCELTKLKKELESGEYITSPETEFTINERGKLRHIHGGRMRDRIVRHTLCDNELTPKLDPYLIYNNGASQIGKGLMFSRKIFERDLHNFWLKYRTNEGYIGLVDLSKFYDNIQHDRVREYVNPKITDEAAWMLDEILKTFEVDVSYLYGIDMDELMNAKFDSVAYYEATKNIPKTGERMMRKAVEIGDQVSQNIGVFYPTPIDNYVKIVRGCRWYGRYMDDMYVICKDRDELISILNGIAEKAKELGMFVNMKKTHIAKLSDTFKYLQVKYTLTETGKIIKRINPKNLTRERRRIKAYKRQLDAGKMTYEEIEQAVRSWMGSFARIMSKKQIKHMKQLYYELFKEELSWKRKSYSKTDRKSARN